MSDKVVFVEEGLSKTSGWYQTGYAFTKGKVHSYLKRLEQHGTVQRKVYNESFDLVDHDGTVKDWLENTEAILEYAESDHKLLYRLYKVKLNNYFMS